MANDIPAFSKAGAGFGVDRQPLERMRESLQVLLGTRGDPLDAALTLRSAIERGLIDRIGNAISGNVAYVNTFPGYTIPEGPVYEPDLTPPPTVTGLTVVAGFSQVIVTFDAPTYTQGHGHKQTNLYAVKKATTDPTMPTFEAGVTPRVFSAVGPLTIVSLPSELNTRWHVWAKYESVDGVESVAAGGGTNGATGTTGQDITQLLDVLTGQITSSQLHSSLSAPIGLITAPATTAGSVNARIKAETDARISAISDEVTARSNGDTTTYNNAKAYTDSYTYSTAGVNSAIAASATTLRSEFAAADTTTLNSAKSYSETWAYSKSSTDAAITAQANSLFNDYTSRDNGVYTNAQTYTQTYAYSKAASDASLASLNTSIRTDFAAADATTLASAQSFTYSRSAIDGSITATANTLRSEFASADSTTLASARNYTESWAYAKANGEAVAGYVTTLQTQVNSPTTGNNPTYAALQAEASTRTDQVGHLQSQYTIKVDVNGYVSGFGIAASDRGSIPLSAFVVRADSFSISSPSGPGIAPATPFIVRTTATTENGVTIPVGVYMDAAYIVNLSAMWARFGTLVADSIAAANISAAKLTLGDGSVGGNLKSTSFGYGSGGSAGSGWLLTPGGTAYLNNAVVYGTVYASAGVFTGTVYASAGQFSGSLSGANITGAVGTFSGSLNVNSGGSDRMEILTNAIKVFSGGIKRVQLGDLSA